MSKEQKQAVAYDSALQIWDLQNDLLLSYGVDMVERSFSLKSQIDENSFNELDVKLSLLERNGDEKGKASPITIKLNNGGGDVYTAWAMVSRIRKSPCKIIVEAHGHVMSAATLIFAAGTIRKASKYCTFMFHEVQTGLDGSTSQFADLLKQLGREQSMICQHLADRSTKSVSFWKKVLAARKDVYFTTSEVKKLGLIEEIF